MELLSNIRNFVTEPSMTQSTTKDALQAIVTAAYQTPSLTKSDAEAKAQQQLTVALAEQEREGTFVSLRSLFSFPVASGVITMVWQLLKALVPEFEPFKSVGAPLILALLIGFFLLYVDLADPARKTPLTNYRKNIKIVIAFINSLFLAAAVLGIDTTIGGK